MDIVKIKIITHTINYKLAKAKFIYRQKERPKL